MTTVRRAEPANLPRLAAALADAFADYAWTRWTVPADRHTQRLRELFALSLAEIGVPSGEVWVAGDAEAVAVWLPPGAGGPAPDRVAAVEARTAELHADRVEQAAAAEAVLAADRPSTPSWYLASVGVRPGRRGRGLGTAVLAPVLSRCDADGTPASLETSDSRNLPFYGRLGFTVHAQVDFPGGPRTWLLWREPNPTRQRPEV